MELKLYRCAHCGNIAFKLVDKGVPLMCCGQKMEELVPNTTDASGEKHVPVVTVNGNVVEVNVGSVDHPMTEEHLIQWIYVHTQQGGQRKALKAGQAPHAVFHLADGDKALSVYAYCNLHGLWMTKI